MTNQHAWSNHIININPYFTTLHSSLDLCCLFYFVPFIHSLLVWKCDVFTIAVANGYKWPMFKMLYVCSESQRCSQCVWILWARQYTSRGRQCCTSWLVLLCPKLNNNYNCNRGFVCQSTFSFSCKSYMVSRIIVSKEHALEKKRWWNSNGLERKCKFHLYLFIQG